MGILIAIDGVDASGKQTQTELLKKRLENDELKIKSVSFPAYDNPSSTLVKMYLNGEFGDKPSDVNAYATSTFLRLTDLQRIKPIGERITKTAH